MDPSVVRYIQERLGVRSSETGFFTVGLFRTLSMLECMENTKGNMESVF